MFWCSFRDSNSSKRNKYEQRPIAFILCYLKMTLMMTFSLTLVTSHLLVRSWDKSAVSALCSSRSLPKRVMSSLVAVLVLTRLDGGNAMLAGLPARQLNRLQHVLHTAAWLVFGARKFVCSGGQFNERPLLWQPFERYSMLYIINCYCSENKFWLIWLIDWLENREMCI